MFSVNVGLSIILYYFARRGKRHKQGLQARKQQTLQGIYTQLKAQRYQRISEQEGSKGLQKIR